MLLFIIKIKNILGNAVSKKWKYLRDYMRNEMAKIPKKRSGDSGGSIVKSSWQYYSLMLFLKDQLTNRKSDGNLQLTQSSTEPDEIEKCDESQAAISETQNSEIILEESQSNQQITEDSSERAISLLSCTETVEPRVALASRKRTRPNEAYGQALLNIEKQKLQYLQQKISKKSTIIAESNDDKMFFDSLLPFVSKIPSHRKLLFRTQVQELVQKFAFDGSLDVSPNRSTDWSYSPVHNNNSPVPSTSFARPSSPSPTASDSQNVAFWLSHTDTIIED